MLANLWSRSSGIHVAEELLHLSEGDSTTPVTHLRKRGERKRGEGERGRERERREIQSGKQLSVTVVTTCC